jgi:hypothetical protein
MGVGYNPKIVKSGLMLHLDAANLRSYPGSGNTWFDISGNGRNATLLNGVAYSSEKSGCLDFNRTTDSYATIPHDAAISSQVFGASTTFTLSGWFVVDEYVDYATLIQKANGGSYSNSTNGIWMEATNEILGISASNVGSNPAGSTARVYYNATPGQWYNVVWTGDGTTASLYINGVFINSILFSSLTVARSENSSPITIGTRSTISTPELDGRIAVVTAYNIGFTQNQVSQNFNAMRGRFNI